MTTQEAHIFAARTRKANAIVKVLQQYRYDLSHVELMTSKEWALVATVAGVNHPGEETIKLIKEAMAPQEWKETA